MPLNTREKMARHPFMRNVGKGNKQSSCNNESTYISGFLVSEIWNSHAPSENICEPGSTVPNLASGRHTILFPAAEPCTSAHFPFYLVISQKMPQVYVYLEGKCLRDIFSAW